MNRYDVLIIGAGPAGLMAAISAKRKNPDKTIRILEKMKSPGRKLLITGNGQCNLTRGGDVRDFLKHYGDGGRFLKHALYSFTNTHLTDFFLELNCPVTEREDGKIFPASLQSQDVLAALLHERAKLGIEIVTSAKVQQIKKQENSYSVIAEQREYFAHNVIVSTGGKSYPETGSTGDGYALAESLAHTITEPKPALTGIQIEHFPFADCAGISLSAGVHIFRDTKKTGAFAGALLFTHTGFSGPAILHITRYLKPDNSLTINFLPECTREELQAYIIKKRGKKTVINLLSAYLPKRLAESFLKVAGIPLARLSAELSKSERNLILNMICTYTVSDFTPGSFKDAMVTAGGILLREINPKTMESRLCKGLFFAGELLDIDGDTGGYNLQAAFSTGFVAGSSI